MLLTRDDFLCIERFCSLVSPLHKSSDYMLIGEKSNTELPRLQIFEEYVDIV